MRAIIGFSLFLVSAPLLAQEETAAVQQASKNSASASAGTVVGTSSLTSARGLSVAGDHHAAIEAFNEIIDRDPRNPAALWSRAEAYAQLGERHRAETDLWNILGIQQRGPYAERAFLELGENALVNKDPRSAEILFDRYVTIAPDEPLAWC